MKKYLLGTFAIALAVGFSAFTKPEARIHKGAKFTTQDTWYSYVGTQNSTERQKAANYTGPTTTQPTCSTGTINECTVKSTVTLVGGVPPANPDFTNATFDGTTGMPNIGSGTIVDNKTKGL